MQTLTLIEFSEIYKSTKSKSPLSGPIEISDDNFNAVVIPKSEWESIKETLYLISIPNMRESIIEGLKTDISDCQTNLEWVL